MKRMILTAMLSLICCVVAIAQPPTTKPVPQRKGWNNDENPLYGNVAKVTHIKKDHSQGVGIIYHHVVYNFNVAGDMVEEIYYQDEYGALKDCKTRWEYYPSGMTKHFVRTDMSGKVLEDYSFEVRRSLPSVSLRRRLPARLSPKICTTTLATSRVRRLAASMPKVGFSTTSRSRTTRA